MKVQLSEARLLIYLVILLLMNGCATAIITGAATGATAIHDRRTTGTFIEDEAIELKAIREFYFDEEIKTSAHINVTSYNLVVLITGEAPTEELKQRIFNIVKNIPKVTHVYNELTIAAPSAFVSRTSDSLITAKVKTKLLTLKNFDGTRVKVVTEKGVVYLMGILTREEADRATEDARTTGGAQKIVKMFQYLN
ncbi:MAG: BON domain-containing protein [Gammaproteobacteria bacterium]